MESMYYIGLDIHKSVIVYCIKSLDGTVFSQGRFRADRPSLSAWIKTVPGRWSCAMEATMFTGWVYDFLLDFAHEIMLLIGTDPIYHLLIYSGQV